CSFSKYSREMYGSIGIGPVPSSGYRSCHFLPFDGFKATAAIAYSPDSIVDWNKPGIIIAIDHARLAEVFNCWGNLCQRQAEQEQPFYVGGNIFLRKVIQVIQNLAQPRQHCIIKGFDFRHTAGLA